MSPGAKCVAIAAWAIASTVSSLGAGAVADDADEVDALTRAANAFEYRDFRKVVDVLDPWIKPPKITDEQRMIEARRLLGISLHVLGDIPRAREEFGHLLRSDPKAKLDPFVVPPNVIETFESVRKDMKRLLDQKIDELERRTVALGPEAQVRIVEVPHPLLTFAPFGIPQFTLDETAGGTIFLSIQAAALVANVLSFIAANGLLRERCPVSLPGTGNLPEPPMCEAARAEFKNLQIVQYTGLASFVAAWGVSIYLGNASFSETRGRIAAGTSGSGPEKASGPHVGSHAHPAPLGGSGRRETDRGERGRIELGVAPLDDGIGVELMLEIP